MIISNETFIFILGWRVQEEATLEEDDARETSVILSVKILLLATAIRNSWEEVACYFLNNKRKNKKKIKEG